MAIARQARDIFLAFAPVLHSLPTRKNGIAKAPAWLLSGLGLIRGAWAGFQAVRKLSR
jgi:hypothetical protein